MMRGYYLVLIAVGRSIIYNPIFAHRFRDATGETISLVKVNPQK